MVSSFRTTDDSASPRASGERAAHFASGGQLLFGVVGDLDFGGTNVFDFYSRGPLNISVVAIEVDRALLLELVLGEHAIFEPEFH